MTPPNIKMPQLNRVLLSAAVISVVCSFCYLEASATVSAAACTPPPPTASLDLQVEHG